MNNRKIFRPPCFVVEAVDRNIFRTCFFRAETWEECWEICRSNHCVPESIMFIPKDSPPKKLFDRNLNRGGGHTKFFPTKIGFEMYRPLKCAL